MKTKMEEQLNEIIQQMTTMILELNKILQERCREFERLADKLKKRLRKKRQHLGKLQTWSVVVAIREESTRKVRPFTRICVRLCASGNHAEVNSVSPQRRRGPASIFSGCPQQIEDLGGRCRCSTRRHLLSVYSGVAFRKVHVALSNPQSSQTRGR